MRKVQKLSASTLILLDNRLSRKDNTFPVKLRVTYNRMQKYYPIGYKVKQTSQPLTKHQQYWLNRFKKTISFSTEEFAMVRDPGCKEPQRTMFVFLNEIESIARVVLNDLPVFTFNLFEEKYFQKPTNKNDLIAAMENATAQLRKDERISTAVGYECATNSLKKFSGKEKIAFVDLTVTFFKDYEKWMLAKKNSLTTVGIYLRNVRTEYRKAEKNGQIPSSLYPFGEGKYEIPTGKNIKKALTFGDVKKLANYEPKLGSIEHRYRDYWLFSYLCNGINIKDMARLTYGKIEGEIIKLSRAKTEREKRHNPRPITIIMTKPLKEIIERWGNRPKLTDQYIFPILSPGMTPEQEYRAIQQAVQTTNKNMARICEAIKIEKVTTYTARHSFATVLKRSGASMEFISESLGHSNISTTENYLADFEIEEKRKWAEKASDF